MRKPPLSDLDLLGGGGGDIIDTFHHQTADVVVLFLVESREAEPGLKFDPSPQKNGTNICLH